ncbi:MAG: GatB/YqeY domain-containing protein [Gammaproteobacteria bacterium]|nr:GatB/YqeY domain-containing protein [Gammaproteobacteria bacterium]
MDLKTRLLDDIKTAMKAKQADRVATLRLVAAAMKQKEVDERISLDDAGVLGILEKMLKQRKESIALYQQGGRSDLVNKEQAEVDIISRYLPQALSETEIDQIISGAITASGAVGIKDMGKVMAQVKPQLAGRADMGVVSGKIKAKLT